MGPGAADAHRLLAERIGDQDEQPGSVSRHRHPGVDPFGPAGAISFRGAGPIVPCMLARTLICSTSSRRYKPVTVGIPVGERPGPYLILPGPDRGNGEAQHPRSGADAEDGPTRFAHRRALLSAVFRYE